VTIPKGRIDPDEAADILHQLLESQKLVAAAAAEENRLKSEELAVERDKVNNRSRELDILAQQAAIEKERLNRADSRLQEVIQRYVTAESKLITTDDSFGETVQRIIAALREVIGALIDVEKAQYALLTKNVDDLQESKTVIPGNLRKLRIQELLLQYAETLHNLQLQVAGHGSLDAPPRLLTEIERIKAQMVELEKGL
jgi:hypothetical protein